MIELTPEHFRTVSTLFDSTHYGALTAATLQGSHPGRVFVDDLPNPSAGLVCTNAGIGYYFLAGQPTVALLDALQTAFLNDFIPAQKTALNNPEVLLFYNSPDWQQPLFSQFVQCRPVLIHKKRFNLPAQISSELAERDNSLPDGMQFARYTPELLAAHPNVAEEAALFYGSVDAFLAKSMGVCILAGDTLASYCHAVFIGSGEAEISIATVPDFRRRGLAYQTARAFLKECANRELVPIWGCWPENAPSVSLAGKLGFCEDASQQVCLWVDSPDWNP